MLKINVNNANETRKVGYDLAKQLVSGDVLLLDGDLGAGKTTFTKGLAEGLGITRNIKSPTFTIIKEYLEGKIPLYHMDIYRLEDGGSDELGLEEYFSSDGISVVEWSKFVESNLPDEYLKIQFIRNDENNFDAREIDFEAKGDHFQKIIQSGVSK